MMPSVRVGSAVLDQFVKTTNGYIDQLHALADDVRSDEPDTADLLKSFAEAHAGRTLDLMRQWPSAAVLPMDIPSVPPKPPATYLCIACWRRIPVGAHQHACFYEE